MKLDRNINHDGKGKYALVRLRTIEAGSEAHSLLKRLDELGVLDWGVVGSRDEFFVIKLRDKFASGAISGYTDAVIEAQRIENDPDKAHDLYEWASQVEEMNNRAGELSPFSQEPD